MWYKNKKGDLIMNYKLILILILAGLLVAFVVQNVSVTEVRFLFWTLAISRALLLFLVLSIGIIVGWLLHSYFARNK